LANLKVVLSLVTTAERILIQEAHTSFLLAEPALAAIQTFWAEWAFAQKVPNRCFRRLLFTDFLGKAVLPGFAHKVTQKVICSKSRQLAQKVIEKHPPPATVDQNRASARRF
jgi:hypothetical protein